MVSCIFDYLEAVSDFVETIAPTGELQDEHGASTERDEQRETTHALQVL